MLHPCCPCVVGCEPLTLGVGHIVGSRKKAPGPPVGGGEWTPPNHRVKRGVSIDTPRVSGPGHSNSDDSPPHRDSSPPTRSRPKPTWQDAMTGNKLQLQGKNARGRAPLHLTARKERSRRDARRDAWGAAAWPRSPTHGKRRMGSARSSGS